MRTYLVKATLFGVVAAIATTACGDSDAVELTLLAEAEGSTVVDITYEFGNESITESVQTPWSIVVEVDSPFDVELNVTNPNDTGAVGCRIELGTVAPTSRADITATCAVSGRADGDSFSIASSTAGVDREEPATVLIDGLASATVPDGWQIGFEADGLAQLQPYATGQGGTVVPDEAQDLLQFEPLDTASDDYLIVYRTARPDDGDLAGFVDTYAAELQDSVSGPPEPVVVGGYDGFRINLSQSRFLYTIDIAFIGDDAYFVQAVGAPSLAEFEALENLRDSLSLNPAGST